MVSQAPALSITLLLWLWVAAATPPIPSRSVYQPEELLLDLVSGPLQGRSIFLLHDSQSGFEVNLNQVLSHISSSMVMIANQENFSMDQYPSGYVRGENYVAVMLFSSSPTNFLNYLSESNVWNPTFLILLAMNTSIDTTEVVSHAVVQRSRYLVLFEQHVVNISKVFYMFTSYPFSPEGHRATLGSWSNKTITSVVDLFPDRYPDLQGAVLYLASWCDDFPIIYVSGDGCIGSSLDTLSLIAHKLNFTYEVQRETQDQHWGALENGNWTGMLGDLKYNGKDLALNWFLLNHNRWKAFDALYPYYAEGFGFLARLPEPAPRWKNLTYSFTTNLWLIIVCSTMVVSCMFSALMPRHMTEGTVDHIQQIILVCAGVVRQVVDLGGDGRWAWQRVWLGWWWLGCIILTTAYTCNLIAFLTVPVYTTRIETVAHLAASDLRSFLQLVSIPLQESTMQALSIKHLQGAFLLHLLGLVAALLILLLELFVFCLA
ncbi:Glutamate receptor ionotropic, delta-1-like 21 [Homarus americanus]|uniref:Glutamate receptor ionotropic, delta-1-like 21 n=1 Tax=Homarus americanus TaxID=6706 RepID=A0A8J5MXP9_HOMAM|nr:Glutamate receptor ionotropic, delta-1-like 21 [Homarus americanus]